MHNLISIVIQRYFSKVLWVSTLVLLCGMCLWHSSLALAEETTTPLTDEFYAKGLEYYWAQNIPQHYAEAFVWLSKAAEEGHPRAQAMQADMFSNGLGVEIDHEKAFALAKVSSASGDVFGTFLLGKYFYWGKGTAKNTESAKKVFSQVFLDLERQAESGDGLAQHGLGWIYSNFSETSKDFRKAHDWYEKVAQQGYAVAQNNLGLMYCHGEGVRKNSTAKQIWYRRAAAQNYPVAQYNLGLSLGKTGDLAGKYQLLVKAAHKNYGPAQAKLGWMEEQGEGRSVDLPQAIVWYQKAAAHGHRWAQNHLGALYEKGRGVSKNYHEAMKWYRMAADNGYGSGLANVGHLFERGFGVERNYVEAREWYEQGAEQGNAYSQSRLGYLYMNGFGVDKDFDKAMTWLLKGARGGNDWARYGIGLIHEKQRQYSQAIRSYLWSALHGYTFGLKRAVYLMVLYPVNVFRA